MNTETGEIKQITYEEMMRLNSAKPNLWVPITDPELERVLRKLSKKERKVVMRHIEAARQKQEEPK